MLMLPSEKELEVRYLIQRVDVIIFVFNFLVDKTNLMVGSYGPKTEAHVFQTPPEEAPSGVMSRGTYILKSKFLDDDKNLYLEWEWALAIKKDWEE